MTFKNLFKNFNIFIKVAGKLNDGAGTGEDGSVNNSAGGSSDSKGKKGKQPAKRRDSMSSVLASENKICDGPEQQLRQRLGSFSFTFS